MYHYVREINNSQYPYLKGLEFKEFKNQINYLKKNFNILSNDDFIEIINTKKIPKKKSVLLTFDDGYKDHYKYVYPYLKRKKIYGNFYPPVQVLKNNKVLDVNKIHFILEKEDNKNKLLNLIIKYAKKYMDFDEVDLEINKIKLFCRYDDKNTEIIKRLLQNHIPQPYREKILNKLFTTILNIDEKEFSKKLYMDPENIIEMYKNKMSIGSHGDYHLWWEKLSYYNQHKEIKNSINYFKKLNVYDENFSVCYPYGSYNNNTIKILKKYNIKYALTTRVDSINKNNLNKVLMLPRHDTNDFR
tara:strand:- start:378 stop:1280 length:903 start_codon:yes stop_codon:yes gene_type:complete